jgi:hypothetical protein
MLWFDQPFGTKHAPWDEVAPDQAVLQQGLKQFNAVNTKESCVVIMKHHVLNSEATVAAYEQTGIVKATPLIWWKVSQNMVGDPTDLVPAFEMLHIGFKSKAGHPVHTNMSKNPLERHNVITGTAQTVRKQHPGDGTLVNPCETPGYVIQWALDRWCQRGDTIVVVGSGAGGDVRGALEWGVNVVGIDSDAKQVQFLRNDLMTLDTQNAKLVDLPKRKQAVKPELVTVTWAGRPEEEEVELDVGKMACDKCGCVRKDGDERLYCDLCKSSACGRCHLIGEVAGVKGARIYCSKNCVMQIPSKFTQLVSFSGKNMMHSYFGAPELNESEKSVDSEAAPAEDAQAEVNEKQREEDKDGDWKSDDGKELDV